MKNSAIYLGGGLTVKSLGFVLIPLYTRTFSVEEYGALSILNVILQFFLFFFLMGITSAALRFYFEKEDANYGRQVYGNALTLQLLTLPLAFLILTPLTYYIVGSFLPSIPVYPYVLLVSLVAVLKPVRQLMEGFLRAQKKAYIFTIWAISFFLVQGIAIVIAVLVLDSGLKGLFGAQLVVSILFSLIAVLYLKKNAVFSFSPEICRRLLLFGLPLIPYSLFTWVGTASSRLMLERFGGLTDVGLFALAMQFSGILLLISTPVDNALLPHFYETAQKSLAGERLGNLATKYFVIIGLLTLLILVLSDPMVKIMADPKFHGALVFIPFLIGANWLRSVSKIFSWGLLQAKKTRLISTVRAASALLLIALLFFSLNVLALGIKGVVYSILLAECVSTFLTFSASQRFLKLRFNLSQLLGSGGILLVAAFTLHFVAIPSSLVIHTLSRLAVFTLATVITLKLVKIELFHPVRIGN